MLWMDLWIDLRQGPPRARPAGILRPCHGGSRAWVWIDKARYSICVAGGYALRFRIASYGITAWG
jgi:hypothetical protein